MKAFSIGLALIVASLSATAVNSADEDATEVFGVTIGVPLSLPACPIDGYTFDSANQLTEVKHPECYDGVFVQFATNQTPAWVRTFGLYITNGVVGRIDIVTRGITVQDQVNSELVNKFGPPATSRVDREENGYGAKFDVINASWKRGDGVITFVGATDVDGGIVSIRSNADVTREQQEKNAAPHL